MKAATIHDDHDQCFCCGVPRNVGEVIMSRRLEMAHLRKRCMGLKRFDDRLAVILLCMTCHQVYDGPRSGSTINGVTYPWITWGQAIRMKWDRDYEYFDLGYIGDLFEDVPELGQLCEPPSIFREALEREVIRVFAKDQLAQILGVSA